MGLLGVILLFTALFLLIKENDDKWLYVGVAMAWLAILILIYTADSVKSEPITYSIVDTTIFSSEDDSEQIYRVLISKDDNELVYLYFNKDEYKVHCANKETIELSENDISEYKSYP